MKNITSKDNPALKKARRLLTKKGREDASALLVEGRTLISEAVCAGYEVECVFINHGAFLRGEAAMDIYPGEVLLDEKLFFGLAQTVEPQSYIAVVRQKDNCKQEHFACDGAWTDNTERILVLDRISDPGNLGTMTRTAMASGIDEIWCIKGSADVFSDKSIRASAGAVFHMPVREMVPAEGCIEAIRKSGAKLFVMDSTGDDLYSISLTGRIAFVVGNESSGPDIIFREAADRIIGIPMARRSESLNAATAAAIVMYEAFRQRTKTDA